MNKKIALGFIGFCLVVIVLIIILFCRNNNKKYDDYLGNNNIRIDEDFSNITAVDDTVLVKDYFSSKGLTGTLFTYEVFGEGVPDAVSEFNTDLYYVLSSNGKVYFAVIVDGKVIEVVRQED